ncbi:hydrogen peroxide-inducible genes activator [Roseospirillum parvum]|uniref:LysR family transcriptional regulator, hydrogen peroxide-inducible genes activator n=1 Tax=Roseospirillum parvum TaxID=83401 RepID=A0A1G7U208_9PROT|nr:hydrogen peroxide-inducible genes activator [Roseospirillum parvum]SDG41632.1 LysR family transcriptional regulator, hydrogen peroxide-inducible genes activator [Roseospirillum parvum]
MTPLPTLRQLSYLVSLAEHLHFGRAAEACRVTQSTLSAGLQDLETLLGTTLVERGSRRQVRLTPVGEDTVIRARALLRDAEALVRAVEAAGAPLSGRLRLGVIPTLAPYLLPRVLPVIRQRHPALRLFLREDQTARLLDQLDSGRLDAGLIALPWDTAGLEVAVLGEEDVWVALPRDHRLADQAAIDPEELAQERLLLLEDGHCLRGHALAACRLQVPRAATADEAGEVFQATSLGTLIQMVAGGLGVTLVPRMAVPVEGGPEVITRPLAVNRVARQVALVWRKGSPLGTDLTLLAATLRPEVAALAAPDSGGEPPPAASTAPG